MPKIYNKIINSPTPPKNTSDIWECNGRLYLYKGGGWEALKTDSEYCELPFDFCTLMLLHQEPEGKDPIQINASEIRKAIENNKIIVMRYDMYGPGGYVLVSGYEDDLIYLSAVMGTDLLHWEFSPEAEFIYAEDITYKVIGEGGGSQADWRAGENEDGYIKNKPFGVNYNAGVKLSDYDVLDFYLNEYDETVIELDYWGEDSILYTDYENKTYIKDIWNNSVQLDLYNGYSLDIGVYTRYDEVEDWDVLYIKCCIWGTLTQEKALEVISNIRIGYEGDFINKLQGDFIDDTVLKTSSQYLNSVAKKTVLNNLGLDPIVWKYICNPIIISDGEKAPEDILTGEFDDTGYDQDFSYYKLKNFVCTAMFKYTDYDDMHIYNTFDANTIGVAANIDSTFYVDSQKRWHRYDA